MLLLLKKGFTIKESGLFSHDNYFAYFLNEEVFREFIIGQASLSAEAYVPGFTSSQRPNSFPLECIPAVLSLQSITVIYETSRIPPVRPALPGNVIVAGGVVEQLIQLPYPVQLVWLEPMVVVVGAVAALGSSIKRMSISNSTYLLVSPLTFTFLKEGRRYVTLLSDGLYFILQP